ncbi:hypothetical protein A6R68_23829, partial [Neotoma lepida]
MVNAYKRIVLLKGLEHISDHYFELFKSLLVIKGKTPLRKRKQEAGSDTPTSTTSSTLASDGGETSTAQVSLRNSSGLAVQRGGSSQWIYFQKRKSINKEKTGAKKTKQSEGPDHPPCPEEATARCQSPVSQTSSLASSNTPLAKSSEHGEKKMFHATVATVNEYFHVKVFNINLKEKFRKENVITISNYFKFKGILEINEASSVFEAGPDQKIEVSNSLIRNANKPPKISDFHKYGPGALKKVNPKTTIYEVKDDKSNIEVVGNGKWYNINCEEGDKLRLFCFQLKTIDKQLKLVCGEHSFIK